VELLKRDGVDAELVSYPAKNGNRFLAHRSFQEWDCDCAELWIEGENRKRIARFGGMVARKKRLALLYHQE
jgi:aminopeptidase YwaD